MKIVIAPDSFKESLSALEVCSAIEAGFKAIFPNAEYIKIPMADGGEGTVESMLDAMNGTLKEVEVTDPLGNRITASYALSGDRKIAIIEMAASSGLMLVPPEKRNPLLTTSYGTGELILDALDSGARQFIIGIGGSATNDGGVGMLQALGAQFLDENGQELAFGGGALIDLKTINLDHLDSRLKQSTIDVACDVDNPLIGSNGASAIFGPQKGADEAMVKRLDQNLAHYASIIEAQLGKSIAEISGTGAAGGMGAALLAFLDGELRPGNEIISEAVKLADAVKDADLVITGEGKIDAQTIMGKTPIGVANVAKQFNRPVIAFAGMVTADAEIVIQHNIDALFSIVQGPSNLDDCLKSGYQNIVLTSRNVARIFKISQVTR